jgi:hypothetical protein
VPIRENRLQASDLQQSLAFIFAKKRQSYIRSYIKPYLVLRSAA